MSATATRSRRDDFNPRIKTRRAQGVIFGGLCFCATLFGIVTLAVLLRSVAVEISQRNAFSFLIGLTRKFGSIDADRAGYRAGIAGSLWLLGLVTAIALPTGIGAAIFLEEYPLPKWLKGFIQTNIANLAGVPSIVYGILGLALFVRGFGVKSPATHHSTLWAGALTLSLLILPTIVIATREALRAVPSSLRQAALALGATRWQVIRDHIVPAALPGISTGAILAISRAIGETAPILMVGAAASIPRVPRGPSDPYTALPVEIYNYAKEADASFQAVASGGILILTGILLMMNSIAIILRNRASRSPRN